MIRKSFGNVPRQPVVYFEGQTTTKEFFPYPVGTSGLCCHILALLLFLKNYAETNEKVMELTCTQQLQRWHKRTNKSSILMIPLMDIKIKSAKLQKGKGSSDAMPTDPGITHFKRDVRFTMAKLSELIDQEKKQPEAHIYSVLMKLDIGKKSSLGHSLHYKYSMSAANALAGHDYLKNPPFDRQAIEIDEEKTT